ncbi:unnamed protein product [Amoebophrya sp. A120]|nr:unnamed protein product [Amoebophrya sp. A120]|eukprot:GSA120T00006968001.1
MRTLTTCRICIQKFLNFLEINVLPKPYYFNFIVDFNPDTPIFHLKHALEHLKKAESSSKVALDVDTVQLVNRAICNINAEATSGLSFMVSSILAWFQSLISDATTMDAKVHDTRMLIEQAAQISRVQSGGSRAYEHLNCAASDLLAHDRYQNIHPLATSGMGLGMILPAIGMTMGTASTFGRVADGGAGVREEGRSGRTRGLERESSGTHDGVQDQEIGEEEQDQDSLLACIKNNAVRSKPQKVHARNFL